MNFLIGTRTNPLVAHDEAIGVEGRNGNAIDAGLSEEPHQHQGKARGEIGQIKMTRMTNS